MRQFTMTTTNGLGEVIRSTRVNGKATAEIAISAKVIEYRAQGFVITNSETNGMFDAKCYMVVVMKNRTSGEKVNLRYEEN